MEDNVGIISAGIVHLSSSLIANLIEDDGSSSSDEEFETGILALAQNLRTNRVKIENYVENVVYNYTAGQFQENFRMPINGFEKLVEMVGPLLKRQGPVGRCTIPVEKQVLCGIWVLANPDTYRSISERFDIAKSTLWKILRRFVEALTSISQQIVKFPVGEEGERVTARFNTLGKIQNVRGCIDGTYINIKAPSEDAQSYINRKCDYAIILQGISDGNLRFIDVFVGYPGAVSDIRVFRNSPIFKNISNNINEYLPNGSFLLGDKAYPLLQWCLVPFIDRGNLTDAQKYFNTVHAKVRQCIERTFALYFGRFRRMKYLDLNRQDHIPSTCLAASVLHNICIDAKDHLLERYIEEGMAHIAQVNNDNNPQNIEENALAINARADLCRTLYEQRQLANE